MIDTNTVTVYWTPAQFDVVSESWTLLYSEPESMSAWMRQARQKTSTPVSMQACPAVNGLFTNLFVVRSTFDDTFDLPVNLEEYLIANNLRVDVKSKLSLIHRRDSLKGYVNFEYNLGWQFFADEPLMATFTAPFYPPHAPASGVILASGEFNIGSWYRSFNLDYHIPLNTQQLSFKENDPLFYIKLHTDKNVVFKRYLNTPILNNLKKELGQSSGFMPFKTLQNRYQLARKTKAIEQILFEIKRNVVE